MNVDSTELQKEESLITEGLLPSDFAYESGTQNIMVLPDVLGEIDLPPIKHNTGHPHLFIVDLENKRRKVYSMLSWGRKKRRVHIKSDFYDNYIDALKDVYHQATQIPVDDLGNIPDELRSRLIYHRRIGSPGVYNTVEIGRPLYVATAYIGEKCFSSDAHVDPKNALDELAEIINKLPVGAREIYTSKELIPTWAEKSESGKKYVLPLKYFNRLDPNRNKKNHRSIILEIIDTGSRELKVRAVLLIGKIKHGLRLVTTSKSNYRQALSEAFTLIDEMPSDSLSNIHAELQKIIPRSIGISNLEFLLKRESDLPVIYCSTIIEGKNYISEASRNKLSAAKSLMFKINQQGVKSAETKKQFQERVFARQLLKGLIERWKREYSWLISMRVLSNALSERKRVVGLLLAVTDPLRKYEITEGAVPELIKQMRIELSDHYHRSTESGRLKLLSDYLFSATTTKTLCPGDSIDLGAEFNKRALSNGDSPDEIKDELVKGGFLRVDRDGNLSLSNKGITLIENELRKPFKPNSFGMNIPSELLVGLSRIKRR